MNRCVIHMCKLLCFIIIILVLYVVVGLRGLRSDDALYTGSRSSSSSSSEGCGAECTERYANSPKKLNAYPEMLVYLNGVARKLFVNLTMENADHFVFVTAASQNHFDESVDAVASIQRHMPSRKTLYYDLGLDKASVRKIKTWCGVVYRKIDWSKLPPHVSATLHTCAWKAVVVMHALTSFDGVLWVDASFRLTAPLTRKVLQNVVANDGLSLFINTHHSNFAVTAPAMYDYIATDVDRQKGVTQFGGGVILTYRTRGTFRSALYWWYRCSLDERCIAPAAGGPYCQFALNTRYTSYANCHRYDQSAINILLSNRWHMNTSVYADSTDFFRIERHLTHRFSIKHC